MPDPYQHVVAFALEHPWAVTPPMLRTIADILAHRIAGQRASDEQIQAALKQRDKLPQPKGGDVAVIRVHGVIVPRGDLFSEMSGATSVERLSSQLRDAMADPSLKTIVLDIDSPGGSVAGATEFAREVMAARTKKPIIAVAEYTMASAAYWIGAAATEVVAAPSAYVGSVGVYTIHDDLSKALEDLGITRTYIYAGKYKVEGNNTEPLSDHARQRMQARVDEAYDRMVLDIARGRGLPVERVRTEFGEGATLGADDAKTRGMVDTIATLHETLTRVATVAPAPAPRAEDVTPPMADTPQEPARATGQDRPSDQVWRRRMETEFLRTAV